MYISRPFLTVLFNALYASGTTRIPVTHPCPTVGELLEIKLEEPKDSIVSITQGKEEYTKTQRTVEREWGSPAINEIPDSRSYINAFLAGGLTHPPNSDEITDFLDRYGYPDLGAGHKPILAGFDTNLLPWRVAEVLDLQPGEKGAVNGFALATGVRDELDWDHKRSNTRPLENAFGPKFEQLWNQPVGANREGRLGVNYYRRLRDHQYADEVDSETGDKAIISNYDKFQSESRKDLLLFSNDRNFIERARTHRILAQRVEFPSTLPATLSGSWANIQNTLYLLTVLFGVLELPKMTLFGVWKGKGGQDWHDDRIKIDCRSPDLESIIQRYQLIIDKGKQ